MARELESGLEEHLSGRWCVPDNGEPCTFILMPEDRFRDYVGTGPSGDVLLHGIPVTYWGGDEIKYCTD